MARPVEAVRPRLIPTDEAGRHVGEKRTVEMTVAVTTMKSAFAAPGGTVAGALVGACGRCGLMASASLLLLAALYFLAWAWPDSDAAERAGAVAFFLLGPLAGTLTAGFVVGRLQWTDGERPLAGFEVTINRVHNGAPSHDLPDGFPRAQRRQPPQE